MSVPVTNPTRLNDNVNFPGCALAVTNAGHTLEHQYPGGTWVTDDAVATQAIIDGYDPVPYARTQKIAAIKLDGLAHIQLIFPAISTFDWLQVFAELWQSIASAARSPTANWTKAVNTWNAGVIAVNQVNAALTVSAVNAVTPVWP